MTQKQVDVWYRSQAITAKPLYISNDDVRRVAADVRGQLVSAVDTCRLSPSLSRVRCGLTETAPGLLASVAAAFRLAASVDRRRSAFAISILLHRLAADFGVSLKFIQVRLLRYGLATGEQLGLASEERRSKYRPCR
jgi:hypothetical protein